MECPHCEYKYGWNSESQRDIQGIDGDFYRLSNNILAKRPTGFNCDTETIKVYACSKCRKLFISED